MPKWTDYTIKTNPTDKDEVMILDTAGKANKRLGLSALSDWILNKLADKVFQKLETSSKTVLGAINELNSNALRSIDVDYDKITIGATGFADLTSKMPQTGTVCMSTIQYYGSITPINAINVYADSNTSYVFGAPNTIINRLAVRYWYTK